MSMSYHKVYRVPTWIVLGQMTAEGLDAVKRFLNEAGARAQVWPANNFPEALEKWRSRGYSHALPASGDYILDSALLVRAAAEHVKEVLGPTSYMQGSTGIPVHRIDRTVKSRDDLVLIFNDLLSTEEDIALSQMFQVAERCHREDIARSAAWYTEGPVPRGILTRIADRVITIGDAAESTVSVAGLPEQEIFAKLTEFFQGAKQ